jgi:hypothetical protein
MQLLLQQGKKSTMKCFQGINGMYVVVCGGYMLAWDCFY